MMGRKDFKELKTGMQNMFVGSFAPCFAPENEMAADITSVASLQRRHSAQLC
jgi:hypothetical protein